MKKSVHRFLAWTIVFVWMGVIFFLSHQSGEASSQLSSGLFSLVKGAVIQIFPFLTIDLHNLHFFLRKFAHFFAYFLLGVFIIHAVLIDRIYSFRMAFYVLLFTVFYAITDEIHQIFIPGRSGEVRDVIIDSSGSAIGIFMYCSLRSFFKRKWKK